MATSFSPYGFKPIGITTAAAYNQKTRQFPIASAYNTDVFYGDLVRPLTDGTIAKNADTTTVTTPGILGVFMGCSYTNPSTQQRIFAQYWPASTVASDAVAYVFDDPEGIFQVQALANTGNTGFSMALADCFTNVGLRQIAGSTATGVSKVGIDGSTRAVTATHPFKVIGFVNSPFSQVGDGATDCIVKYNLGAHYYHNTAGLA